MWEVPCKYRRRPVSHKFVSTYLHNAAVSSAQDLMSMGFDTAVLLISAYANPVETMEHARRLGYRCTDFMVTPLPFGYYSSEPKVREYLPIVQESMHA